MSEARSRAYRVEQVWLLALERALHARKFAKQHFDYDMSEALIGNCVSAVVIQLKTDGWHHQMPTDATLSQVILESHGKAAAKQEANGGSQ